MKTKSQVVAGVSIFTKEWQKNNGLKKKPFSLVFVTVVGMFMVVNRTFQHVMLQR